MKTCVMPVVILSTFKLYYINVLLLSEHILRQNAETETTHDDYIKCIVCLMMMMLIKHILTDDD